MDTDPDCPVVADTVEKSERPPDASESRKHWCGEAPQNVFRGTKVQNKALSAPLAIGKTP
jgi:hypothetical protein